jgi:hypothetical protein
MCPDRKLKWFQDHGRNLQQIKSIKSMICDYWENVYAGEEENELSEEENKVSGKTIFEILLLNSIFSQSDHNMPLKKISLSRTTFKLTLMNPGYQHQQSRKWEVI